jgi:hypothetical protein
MTDLLVIVPSRGRPGAVSEMLQAFGETCRADTRLMFAIDDADPDGPAYVDEFSRIIGPGNPAPGRALGIRSDASSTMVQALNLAVLAVIEMAHAPYAIAFMGDDHRPRTVGWDSAYLDALRRLGSGIVYGDDLVQGERLPTQCAMTADIPRALGYMAPPVLRHMYVDNFWRDLGIRAGCLRFLRDVVVEHLHPIAGTAETDAGYERVNSSEVFTADEHAYRAFCAQDSGLPAAVAAVRELQPADPKRERHIAMARASFTAEAAYITGARTVADVAAHPTDLAYLLGGSLQVRSTPGPLAADVVCVTELERDAAVDALRLAGAAAVTAGLPLEALAAAGLALVRTRTIGDYPVALAVRR